MAVYYSKHNDDVYLDEYNPGPYTLYGHNIFARKHWDCKRPVSICIEDITSSGLHPEEYYTLVITEDISEVKPGFIESFPNLQDLIVEADLKKIECSPELEALLKKNNVVLRGHFNSPAEKLANRLGVRFIHKNIFLAVYINRKFGTIALLPGGRAALLLAGRQDAGHLRRQHRRRDRPHGPRRRLLRRRRERRGLRGRDRRPRL